MAKVGTAHLEIKPVLNEEALAVIAETIQQAVEKGVRDGMAAAFEKKRDAPTVIGTFTVYPNSTTTTGLAT